MHCNVSANVILYVNVYDTFNQYVNILLHYIINKRIHAWLMCIINN